MYWKTKWHIQATLVNVQRGDYTVSNGSEAFLKAKCCAWKKRKKRKCWTNDKSWATVLFLHCDEYEGRNVWCWGEKKKGRASHTKQMKVSECIIQEAGQGMLENIFKRTAGSLPASVRVLNIGMASSVWRNWYWLNNLSRLRLNPPHTPQNCSLLSQRVL